MWFAVLAAGQRDVELLAGEPIGADDVAGAFDSRPGGDALGAVDGAGVAQCGVGGDVVGGQAHGLVLGAPTQRRHGHRAVAVDAADDPAVTVFHPSVAALEAQPAGVFAGGDPVAGRGGQPVAEGDGGRGACAAAGEAVEAGAFVELRRPVRWWGRAGLRPARRRGRRPRRRRPCRRRLVGADMHAPVVDVEADAGGIAVAHARLAALSAGSGSGPPSTGCRASWRAAMSLHHPAGRDRGQLLVVADQAHAGAAGQGVADDGVEVEGRCLAGFVDDEQGVGADRRRTICGRVVGGGRGPVRGRRVRRAGRIWRWCRW